MLARAERGAGSLANQQGDYASARDHHSAALAIERQLGNKRGLANQLGSLARVEANLHNFAQARALRLQNDQMEQKQQGKGEG